MSRFDFLVHIVEKRSETNEKRKKILFRFFFSSYRENSSKIDHILNTKMTVTRKIKTENLIFRLFQKCVLSCEFEHI